MSLAIYQGPAPSLQATYQLEVANDTQSLDDADRISEWARKWGLEFNLTKTKVMVFGKTSPIKIYLDGIELTDSHRQLGVVIDKDLNFTDHVDHALGEAK